MGKNLLFLSLFAFFLFVPLSGRAYYLWDAEKSDLYVVDHYLHPFNGSESGELAVELLIRGPRPGVIKALCDALRENDPRSLFVAPEMIVRLQIREAVPFLVKVLRSEKSDYRILSNTIEALGHLGGPQAVKALEAYYKKGLDLPSPRRSGGLRLEALRALGSLKVEKYRKVLKKEAAAAEGVTQVRLYDALAKMGDPSIRQAILDLLTQSKDPKVIGPALSVLARVGKPEDLAVVDQAQEVPRVDYESDIALELIRCQLGMMAMTNAEKVKKLEAYFQTPDQAQLVWAIDRLGELGTPEALAVLELHLNDPGMGNSKLEILTVFRRNGKRIDRVLRKESQLLKVR